MADIKDIARYLATAARERNEACHSAKERRLAGAVRPAHERQPRADLEIDGAKDHTIVEDDRGIVERCA